MAWDVNDYGTSNFMKWVQPYMLWGTKQGDKVDEATKQAIESYQKGAEKGVSPVGYENVQTGDGRTALRMTDAGAEAYGMLGEGMTSNLEAQAEAARKAQEFDMAGKKIDRMILVDKNATEIIEKAFAEKAKVEKDGITKYPQDLLNTKLKSAKLLYNEIKRDIDPMQYKTVADWKQAKQLSDETLLTKAFTDFQTNPSAKSAIALNKITMEIKKTYGGPEHQYKVIDDALQEFNKKQIGTAQGTEWQTFVQDELRKNPKAEISSLVKKFSDLKRSPKERRSSAYQIYLETGSRKPFDRWYAESYKAPGYMGIEGWGTEGEGEPMPTPTPQPKQTKQSEIKLKADLVKNGYSVKQADEYIKKAKALGKL
jgi:hypothetical protein